MRIINDHHGDYQDDEEVNESVILVTQFYDDDDDNYNNVNYNDYENDKLHDGRGTSQKCRRL